jgi:hypothetical protein
MTSADQASSGIDVATLTEMMEAYAADAVEHARGCGVTLDYSDDSVKGVEAVLERLYAEMPHSFLARLFHRGPSEDQVWSMCKMYGGYIGEVVRRTRGGEWVIDADIAPGEQVIALRKGDSRMFPPSKVHKRLTNGPEDNVWFYFQAIAKERWR